MHCSVASATETMIAYGCPVPLDCSRHIEILLSDSDMAVHRLDNDQNLRFGHDRHWLNGKGMEVRRLEDAFDRPPPVRQRASTW